MKIMRADIRKKTKSWWMSGSREPRDSEQSLGRKMITFAILEYLCPESDEHRVHAESWIFDEQSTDRDAGSFPWYCKKAGVNRKNVLLAVSDKKTATKLTSAFKLANNLNELREKRSTDEPLRKRAERAIAIAKSGLSGIFSTKPQ